MKAFSMMSLAGGVILLAALAGAASGTTITLDATLPPEVGVRFEGGSGNSGGNSFGTELGDVNGDGIDDFAVSDCRAPEQTDSGVFVVYGHAGSWAGTSLVDIKTNSNLGYTITMPDFMGGNPIHGIGDWNGDGVGDLLIGGWEGNAYVVFGHAGTIGNLNVSEFESSNARGFRISGTESSAMPDGIGDFNGDGLADFTVPHKLNSDRTYSEMVVLVGMTGQAHNVDLNSFATASGEGFKFLTDGFMTGESLVGVGDVNADGFDDVVYDQYTLYYGHGGALSDIQRNNSLPKTELLSCFEKYGMDQNYDINNDGIDDFVFPCGSPSGSTAYVYCSTGSLGSALNFSNISDPDKGFAVTGEAVFGAVASAGDFNGDGFSDFIMAGVNNNYIIYGGATGLGNIDVRALPPNRGMVLQADPSEYCVNRRGVGDVNADGLDDVIVQFADGQLNLTNFLIFGKGSSTAAEGWELY